MRRSFLRFIPDVAAFEVKFNTYAESHALPKLAGFSWTASDKAWHTTDPVAVARLALNPEGVVEASDVTIAAFDALRPSLPAELCGARLIQTVLEADLQAAAAVEAARKREESASYRASVEAVASADAARAKKESDQQAKLAAERDGLMIRYHPEGIFAVREGKLGFHCLLLDSAGFRYSAAAREWQAGDVVQVDRFASKGFYGPDAVPATAEAVAAATAAAGRSLNLVVASSEAEEDRKIDGKTMAHLDGATAELIALAYEAVRFLAEWDRDHATIENSAGFGKAHVDLGHKLATMDPAMRRPINDAYAMKLAHTYRKQLEGEDRFAPLRRRK